MQAGITLPFQFYSLIHHYVGRNATRLHGVTSQGDSISHSQLCESLEYRIRTPCLSCFVASSCSGPPPLTDADFRSHTSRYGMCTGVYKPYFS